MKAVILAAGKGTRMKELTNELPKPMLRVQGEPILEHIVAGVDVAAGVTGDYSSSPAGARTLLKIISETAKNSERTFQLLVRRPVQDGTGKAPELAKDFIGHSPFLLTYGDILVAHETYPQMLRRFGEKAIFTRRHHPSRPAKT